MKPSLHELISDAIFDVALDRKTCNTLAEQIIKIVRDYHLVEAPPFMGGADQGADE